MSGTDYADRRQLINRNQIAARGFRDEAFLSAFAKAPRETYVDHRMDAGEVGADDRLLEVGAVTGYAAAVLFRIAGQVHAIEWYEALARQAAARIRELA